MNESTFVSPKNGPRLSLRQDSQSTGLLKGKLKTQPLTQLLAAENTLTPLANKMTRGMSGFCVATGFEDFSV